VSAPLLPEHLLEVVVSLSASALSPPTEKGEIRESLL
jgi:hypothetical protein